MSSPTLPSAPSPRSALASDLAAHVARLLAVGDVAGAKVAGDAMMRLLALEAPQTGGAAIVDLADERARRGR